MEDIEVSGVVGAVVHDCGNPDMGAVDAHDVEAVDVLVKNVDVAVAGEADVAEAGNAD